MRVASFNVGCKDLGYFIAKIADDEVLSSAELIFLQEIEEYHTTKEVKETLQHYGYYHFAPSRSLKKGQHGIGILSKLPINHYEILDLPGFDLRLRTRKRIAVRGVIEKDGHQIQVCNVHLDSRLNITDRISQIKPFIDTVKTSHPKVILGGDFNTIPLKLFSNLLPVGKHDQSKLFTEFLKNEGFITYAEQPKYSMKSRGVRWLLDFIYVQNLKITQYGVRDTLIISDHHPVWADIDLD